MIALNKSALLLKAVNVVRLRFF